MSITTMGYIVVVLALVIMGLLLLLAAIYDRYLHNKVCASEHKRTIGQQLTALVDKHKRIVELKADLRNYERKLSNLDAAFRQLEKDLKNSHAHLSHHIQIAADQEALILMKDNEIEYIQNEKDQLHKRINDLDRETPEHTRALLLDQLNECKNLGYLNRLLEEANSGYAKELKEERAMVDHLVRQLKDNNIEPDLEPNEAATSAEPNPAEEPIEESCCF